MSYGAIIAIEQNLKADHNVLEFGCGGSTIFFSRRCNSVRSYEENPEWIKRVEDVLPKPSNVSFVLGNHEVLIESIKKEPDEYYDWILSDIGRDYRFRLKVINESVPKLKRGGYMIVDNYQEKHLVTFDYTGWNIYRFDHFGWNFKGTMIAVKP